MPEQSARDIPSAPEPTPVSGLGRRGWLRILVVTLALLLVLTGLEVGVRVVPPDTVQVRAIAPESGQTLAVATVTDKGTVADWYARFNRLLAISPLYNCSPGPRPGAVTVELDFMRWGLPVEAATLPGYGCAWVVNQGAIPSERNDPNGQTRAILSEVHALLPGVTWP